MKKLLTGLFVLAFSVSMLAAEKTYDCLGFTFSVPLNYESTTECTSYGDVNKEMTSVAFGIQGLTLYNNWVGLYSDFEIVFPLKISADVDKSTNFDHDNEQYSLDLGRSDFDRLWGMSFLIAPAFRLYRNEKILVTAAPGLHLGLLYAGHQSVFYGGLGANVQAGISLGPKWSLIIGTDMYYDLPKELDYPDKYKEFHPINTTRDFTVAPRIGFGYRK